MKRKKKYHFEKASDGLWEVWMELEPEWWEVMGFGKTKKAAKKMAGI